MRTQKRFRIVLAIVAIAGILALASCAPGPNGLSGTANADGKTAGFWSGLWHGFIAPFAFIVSIFSKAVSVYEVHNTGGWYNFGYIMGLSAIFGGGGTGSARIHRKRRAQDGWYGKPRGSTPGDDAGEES